MSIGILNSDRLNELLEECGRAHGHICPGQILGVRMALLGCQLVGINDPRGSERKKLMVWVEIDRCMADAVGVAAGVSLGRRTLKYADYGKVAASFLNITSGNAVRVIALDSARELADARFPEIANKKERQMRAYSSAGNDELFKVENVKVFFEQKDMPGRPIYRAVCVKCGEGINDGRDIKGAGGETLCRNCFSGGYYVVE